MRAKLLARRQVAEETLAFEFEKPAGFRFAAGQALEVRLIEPKETDAEGDGRSFSIASAPSAERLEIATRMRDTAFKRSLKTMPLDSPVELDGPFGSLTLHKAAAKPAVFVAGGIGITPFMSMLRQAAVERATRSFFLLTSNRRPEDAPFHAELERLAGELSRCRFVAVMTQADRSTRPWSGPRGKITPGLIAETVPDLKSAVCYAAGPPAMVAAMRLALIKAGADEDSIRTEDFAGY